MSPLPVTDASSLYQGPVPLRWGCALPSPNAPGKAPNHWWGGHLPQSSSTRHLPAPGMGGEPLRVFGSPRRALGSGLQSKEPSLGSGGWGEMTLRWVGEKRKGSGHPPTPSANSLLCSESATEQLSPCTTTIEPAHLQRVLHNEKPCTATEAQPPALHN